MVILFTVFISKTNAVPAYPYPIKYTQPDGSVITVQLKGDERVHWAESSDGYTLLSNGKNGWEYAVADQSGDIKASGILAREVGKRTVNELKMLKGVSKNIRFSSKQVNTLKAVWEAKYGSDKLIGTGEFFKKADPKSTVNDGRRKVFTPKGTKKLIMILIEYTDVQFTKTRKDFVDLMNTQDYNMNGAQGCVRQYFSEMSYNQFNVTTDVAPNIYTADYDMAHYGAPNGSAHDIRANDLMKEAIQKADPDVDYTQYDNDNDGSIDGVYIIYAGYGEATGGGVNTIWPHAGGVTGTFDTKTASKYSCSNELNTNGTLTSIGVICHEFGHVCGAPDYYDTNDADGGSFTGTGNWDLMCYGVYNGSPSGSQPAHFNPFEKIRAGWLTPITLATPIKITDMPDITTTPVVYKYNTNTDGEYYLMENRQKTGFNASCPGHGLMIYHYSKNYWDANRNKTAPQGFYPVCASSGYSPTTTSDKSTYGSINTGGCPFPGTSAKTSFTDDTTPTAKDWGGNNTAKPITTISESNGLITFTFISVPSVNPILSFEAKAASSSQINLTWTNNSAGNSVIIARNTSATFGTPVSGTTYTPGTSLSAGGEIIYAGSAESFDDTGLSASTPYYYQIWATDGTNYSDPATVSASTACSSVSLPLFSEGFEGGLSSCWEQEHILNEKDWAIQTGGYTGSNAPSTAHTGTKNACLFSNGWTSYTTKLITPPINISAAAKPTLKFWHTQSSWSGRQDILRVYYRTSLTDTWKQLAIYTNSITSWTLETIDLPNPSSAYYIAFETNTNYGYGVCLDDIEVWKDAGDNQWTGATSTDWFDASNWSTGVVPTSTNNVEIPSGTPYSPVISATGAACQNIIIDNGATLTMNNSTAYTLTVTGDWTNNGTFAYGVGKVSFQSNSALQKIQGASKTDFYTLEVNKSSIDNILEATSLIGLTAPSSNLSLVSGTLKISSSSTITPLTSTILSIGSSCGLWNNGATIDLSLKQFNLSGKFINSAGTSSFYFLLPSSSSDSLILEGGVVNVKGYFKPTTGSIVNYNQTGGDLLINSSSSSAILFSVNEGSSFTMSGGNIIIQKASSAYYEYQNLATTYNVTGGTLQIGNISTNGSPIIRINSTVPAYNLVLNTTGTPTAKLIADLTVKGDVTLGLGTKLDLNSLNLSLTGNWINNGGTLTATPTGTVIFNGPGAQSIAGSSNTTFNNLTIDNTSGVTINSNLTTVGGALLINSGKVLNVAPTKALTVNGTFTNDAGNNGLVLQSDANGTATFLDDRTVNTAVGATVQQYLPSVRNWYMSSPVYGATTPSGNTYYKYVEAANNGITWTPVSSGSVFNLMTGYIVKPDAATTFAFSGALNTGVKQITGLTSTATAKTGFNLVGNPYPSYVNWMSATKTNLSTTIWYRTQNSATTPAYVFDTYNETANTGTNNNGVAAVTEMIPPMQAFWVKVNAGTTGSLSFDNNMRSHQDVTTNKFRAPALNATQQVLRLQVSNGANSDEAIVLFNTNATDGFDAYDSQKMTNGNASIPEIYTLAGTEKVVINGLNSIATNATIPLGFTTGATNTFCIKASQVSNFDADTKIVLIDNVLQVEQEISDGTPYYFASDVASMDNRFSVVFRSKSSTTDIDKFAEEETIIISQNANNQIVVTCNRNDQAGVVMVSNAIGQKLYSATIIGITTVITKSFNPGIYLVTVNEGDKYVTKKVIIN